VFSYAFWRRYLEVFDQVKIVARAQRVAAAAEGWLRVDGDRVAFSPVPYYVGPFQYLLRARAIRLAVCNGIGDQDAVILRVPSPLAACLAPRLRSKGRPFGVQVVGDPYDVFGPGAVRHPLRFFFRWWFSRQVRRQCTYACASAYVTEKALQRRYPGAPGAYSTYFSDVELCADAFTPAPRTFNVSGRATLIHVGTMSQLYKAQDVLLDALALCLRDGFDLRLVFVGDGRHRAELEERARVLGLAEHVEFLGQLPAGVAVRERLDKADVFMLPSRTEGLPRALIEAMARGLPCIGSTVGGIPELLAHEDVVPPGNAVALAQKIIEVVGDHSRMTAMSARNQRKAQEYQDHILAERRRQFYRAVRDRTAEWLAARGAVHDQGV
jgi:glycosyltransferase involved in cell wall biosynthesis